MPKSKIEKIGKENLQKLLDESSTYGEVLKKIGLSVIANNFKTLKKYIELYELSTDFIDENRLKYISHPKYNKESFLEMIKDGNCKLHNNQILRKLIDFKIKEYKCDICGIKDWNGKEIVLELHHKNGVHSDNRLNNLQILCPNCHSQTNNFRAKNIKN